MLVSLLSAGVVELGSRETASDFLRRADAQMYQQKQSNRFR